jgi:hypothetical protein
MTMHAPLAPSSMERTLPCPGSVPLSLPFLDQPETDDQKEGTAGHWAGYSYARGIMVMAGEIAPNGIAIDEDMVDGALLYIQTIGLQASMRIVEETISAKRIHEACWGTPDYADYDPGVKLMRVIDYKYGHGYVEVFENPQLVSYAIGLLDHWGLNDLEVLIEFVIVQPRCFRKEGPVSKWRVKASALRAFVNKMRGACEEAMSPTPRTNTGSHCKYCPARHVCTALLKSTASIADMTMLADPLIHTAEGISSELRILLQAEERLEARRTGLEAQALQLIKQGKTVPGFGIEHTTGRRKWTIPVDEIRSLGLMFDKELVKPSQAITPAQAINLGIDASVIEAYSETPHGAPKLTPVSADHLRKIFYQV